MSRFQIVSGQPVVDWVAARTNEFGSYGAAVGIGLCRNDQLIGAAVFNEYNGVNINAHVAGTPGKRWVTRDFLWACFDYAFNTAAVKRVTGLVGEGNQEARLFDEGLGFVLETRLADAHPTGDLLIYRMYRHECRWLSVRHSDCKRKDDEIRLAA